MTFADGSKWTGQEILKQSLSCSETCFCTSLLCKALQARSYTSLSIKFLSSAGKTDLLPGAGPAYHDPSTLHCLRKILKGAYKTIKTLSVCNYHMLTIL